MDVSDIVALHLLVLGRVETGEAHDLHHLDLLVSFPLKVLLGQYRGLGNWGPVLAAACDPLPRPRPVT